MCVTSAMRSIRTTTSWRHTWDNTKMNRYDDLPMIHTFLFTGTHGIYWRWENCGWRDIMIYRWWGHILLCFTAWTALMVDVCISIPLPCLGHCHSNDIWFIGNYLLNNHSPWRLQSHSHEILKNEVIVRLLGGWEGWYLIWS